MTTPSKAAMERARKLRDGSWASGEKSFSGAMAFEFDRMDCIARELRRTECITEAGHALLKQLMLPDPEPTPETHEAWHLAGQSSPIEFQRRLDAAGLTVVRKEDE